MKVLKFVINNYKSIRGKKTFTPNGASFFLIGGNGQGKTSVGRSIMDMLTKRFPSKPVTEGETEGFIECTLDDGSKVLCQFVEGKKPLLELIDPSGESLGSPKVLLQQLSGNGMTFSIDELLSMQPKPLRAKMEAIVGLDLTKLNAKEEEAYKKRTAAKNQLEAQQARTQGFDFGILELAENEEASVVEISQELSALNKRVSDHERMKDKLEGMERRVTEKEETIALLKKQLEEAETDLVTQKQKVKDAKAIMKDQKPPKQSEIDALTAKMETVEEDNRKIAEAKKLKEDFDLLAQYQKTVDDLEALVDRIRKEKDAEIKKCPLPAEGLEFGVDGGLTLDGLPFEDSQIATSRKIIAGIQIAMSMLGEIKYLHFDGAALDKASADHILKYAEDNGLQLCIERPIWEGGALKLEVYDETGK